MRWEVVVVVDVHRCDGEGSYRGVCMLIVSVYVQWGLWLGGQLW